MSENPSNCTRCGPAETAIDGNPVTILCDHGGCWHPRRPATVKMHIIAGLYGRLCEDHARQIEHEAENERD